MEEGELVLQKENKQQKMTKDPRDRKGNSVDSRGEVEIRRPQRPWAPDLKWMVLSSHTMLQYGTRQEAMPTT